MLSKKPSITWDTDPPWEGAFYGGHDCTKFATARGNMTAMAIWPLAKLLWALGVLLEFLVQYNMLKRCVNLYII